ncbi:MAG: V-type ATP synthase subunit D [Caldilineaceae bacterium]|nr:V-type ATP synthase subunit D [Caldilineaceae bacterium]
MDEHVNATRMELLALRVQIELARQGRDLLKEKRNALMKELMQVADTVLRGSDALDQAAGKARQALALAEAIDGPEAVQSASFAAQGQVALTVEGSHVMGVPIPRISAQPVARGFGERGYHPASASVRIDAVAAQFEEEVDLIIDLAAREVLLRRLADEIARTGRRVNALEQIVVPRLMARRDRIRLILEEREREDHFRLKRVKRALESKRHADRTNGIAP